MKKSDTKNFVVLLLILCVLLGCGVGYLAARSGGDAALVPDPALQAEPRPEVTPLPEDLSQGEPRPEVTPIPEPIRGLDYEAIRALHAPEDVVGSVAGRDVRWEEMFYWLHDVGLQAEQYMQTLAMYGQSLDWTDKLSAESEATLAEDVVSMAQDYAAQLNIIEALAEESGAVITEENEAELAERLQQAIEGACGEGAGEEEFNALLEEQLISRTMFDRLERANYLYQNSFAALYGENGEKVSEEDARAFLRDGDYLCASHILFMTVDDSFEPLDEETAAEKLRQAEAVSAELRAIPDDAERAARFAELKEQYCEDSGKERFPAGYLFTPGTMVEEFENGVKALEDYEVSEPILSAYGYHVIMRLPLSVEMTMNYSEAGTPLDARAVYANEQFNALMASRVEQEQYVPAEGFSLNLLDYLK